MFLSLNRITFRHIICWDEKILCSSLLPPKLTFNFFYFELLRSDSAADRIKTVVAKQYGARLFGRYYFDTMPLFTTDSPLLCIHTFFFRAKKNSSHLKNIIQSKLPNVIIILTFQTINLFICYISNY